MVYRTTVRLNCADEYDLEYLVQKRLESVCENFKEIRVINIQESTEVRGYGNGENYEKYIKVVIWYEGLNLEEIHKKSMNKTMETIWDADTDTWENLPL